MTYADQTPLDDALAVARALSKRIRVAAERGDTASLEQLSEQRKAATAEVDRLLILTAGDLR